jgi:ATP-binding cassette subfamily F protein 3
VARTSASCPGKRAVGDETILQIATSGGKLEPENDDDWDIDYTLEPRAKKILAGLGFRESDHDKLAKTFSGGWVMRAHLARLLVSEPTLLLLDEPTNHLDLEALLWFQDYLTRYPGGLVVISHDRAFLNALCTGMIELRGQRLHEYTGNYDDFLVEREARKQRQQAMFRTSSARSPTCRRSSTASAPRLRWPPARSRRRSRSPASKRSRSTSPKTT